MEDENLGQLDEVVPHLGLCLFVATFARVVVVQRVLCVILLQALDQGGLVLQALRHERVVRCRLVSTLATLHDCLHDARENAVDNCIVAPGELRTDLLHRFLVI